MNKGSWIVALVLGCVMGIGSVGCSSAGGVVARANQQAPAGTGLATKTVVVDGHQRPYGVFVPHAYTPEKKWPVIVFLHGVLEGGSDGTKNLGVGLGPYVADHASEFGFIAVFPQSTSDWKGEEKARQVIATLDQVAGDYSVDPKRVILTGLSNGGHGVWAVAARYPDRFAGLVPMCGHSDLDDVDKLTKIPIWCFHNSVDPFVPSGGSKEMCQQINKLGGNAKYTQYGDFGHNCWDKAYSDGELWKWMAGQSR